MLDDAEITALRSGKLELPCLRMRIEQNRPDFPVVYEGSGEIYQNEERRLALRILLPGQPVGFRPNYPLGEIIPPEEYFNLTATDMSGRVWTASYGSPRLFQSVPGGGAIANALLPEITSVSDLGTRRSQPNSVRIVYFSPMEFPANERTQVVATGPGSRSEEGRWNATRFTSDGILFTMTREPEQFVVVAVAGDAALPPRLAERITEALQFTMGLIPWEGLIRKAEGGRETLIIAGRAPEEIVPHISRPIPTNWTQSAEATISLFSAYMAFVLQSAEEEVHPLSAEWGEILRGSAGTLETETLMLGVGVEAVVRITHPANVAATQAARQRQDELRTAIGIASAALDDPACPASVRTHVRNKLHGMLSQGTREKLDALAEAGVIDRDLVANWSYWRHPRAHGSRRTGRSPQDWVDGCEGLIVLLYQLVFGAIGYSGPYTNFRARNWPAATYPPLTRVA